jgi:hypothetical protein
MWFEGVANVNSEIGGGFLPIFVMAMSWNIKVSRKSSGNSERGVERNSRRKFGVNRRGYRGILVSFEYYLLRGFRSLLNKCCRLTLSKSSTAGCAKPGIRIPPRVSTQRKFGFSGPAGGHPERFSNVVEQVWMYMGVCVYIQDRV